MKRIKVEIDMRHSTSPRQKRISHLLLGTVCVALSLSTAQAQTRAEQAAERRAMAEQRLEALADNRAERAVRRTEVLVRMSEVTPEMVQDRLDQAEVRALEALAEADVDLIASKANEAGTKASYVLTVADLEELDDEQVDRLVAAAARAASITPEDVEALLAAGATELSDFFDGVDADEIASTLNEIGAKGLGVEVMR